MARRSIVWRRGAITSRRSKAVLPRSGAGYGDASGLVRILTGDCAVEVIEHALVGDDGGLVGEGFVDAVRRSGVDQYLRYFDEGVRIDAERKHLAGAAGTLIVEAEIKHGEVAAVLHYKWVGSEAAVTRVRRGRLGGVNGIRCRIGCAATGAVAEHGIFRIALPGFEIGGGGDTGLLVPASADGCGQRVGLG